MSRWLRPRLTPQFVTLLGQQGGGASSLLNGLLAYYAFESGAFTDDSSGNGNNLTDVNTVGATTDAGRVASGQAADFVRANSEYFSLSGSPIDANADFSIFGFGRVDSSVSGDLIMIAVSPSTFAPSTAHFAMFYNNSLSPAFRWRAYPPTNGTGDVQTTITLDTVFSYYLQWQASTKTLGLSINNAALLTTVVASDNRATGGQNLYLGALPTASTAHDGTLDEISVHNRFLTEAERTYRQSNRSYADLLAYTGS